MVVFRNCFEEGVEGAGKVMHTLNLTWGIYFDGGRDRVDILTPVRGESVVRTLGVQGMTS